jgi:hypothetical protein
MEHAINEMVARRLESELGRSGLLLAAEEFVAAEREVAPTGARLLAWAVGQCYPIIRQAGQAVSVEFSSAGQVARFEAALAFGAVTARVLAPVDITSTERFAQSVEPTCALFNLGIGLVDYLCDHDPPAGAGLLQLIREQDLATVATKPPDRGWFRGSLARELANNATVAFTAEVIEAFFEAILGLHPGHPGLARRQQIGTQLRAALEAEWGSVSWSAADRTGEQLIRLSRLTSVLPFQIIESLACAGHPTGKPTRGTRLGEAMWRIDDLVDLCDDARSGSLNSLLLRAATSSCHPMAVDRLAALERLVVSTDLASAAREATNNLLAGLGLARSRRHAPEDRGRTAGFLFFIQRYTGIALGPAV